MTRVGKEIPAADACHVTTGKNSWQQTRVIWWAKRISWSRRTSRSWRKESAAPDARHMFSERQSSQQTRVMVGDWLPLVDEHALFSFRDGFLEVTLRSCWILSQKRRRFAGSAVQVASRAIETAALATILDG